jgi:hypothetical protein
VSKTSDRTSKSNQATKRNEMITDFSQHPAAAALERMRSNERISRIRLIVPHDACPACRQVEGDYAKDQVPEIPLDKCSHPLGCRSFYEPMLTEVYP